MRFLCIEFIRYLSWARPPIAYRLAAARSQMQLERQVAIT